MGFFFSSVGERHTANHDRRGRNHHGTVSRWHVGAGWKRSAFVRAVGMAKEPTWWKRWKAMVGGAKSSSIPIGSGTGVCRSGEGVGRRCAGIDIGSDNGER